MVIRRGSPNNNRAKLIEKLHHAETNDEAKLHRETAWCMRTCCAAAVFVLIMCRTKEAEDDQVAAIYLGTLVQEQPDR